MPRRILIHDFSGHPFQVQLSRELARRGHEVLHVECASFTTGKGAVANRPDDAPSLRIHSIALDEPFEKYSALKRVRQEHIYGKRFTRVAAEFGPDIVISSNDPLLAKRISARWCRRTGTPWIFWLQDIYSIAMGNIARSRLPIVSGAAGAVFRRIERRLLQACTTVIAISPDFVPVLRAWGIEPAKCEVIENWAPLEELPARPRANPWSNTHGLDHHLVFLYAGTLGLKHNPDLLLQLARRYHGEDGVRLVIASEGPGAEWLERERAAHGLENLVILGFQPYADLPDMFGAADVLVALLEADAGIFSAPSKILSYMCAARPLLAAVPDQNLAARLIKSTEAGLVVEPDDVNGFLTTADRLLTDTALRDRLGTNARHYAEDAFDIETIGDRFEGLIERSVT